MNCTDCGAVNPAGARFCSQCGTPLAAHCPACGVDVAPAARFCHQCGTGLTPSSAKAPADDPGVVERRQLTVMFCDLVGSVQLSSALDPEDLRDVVRDYRDACGAVVNRYEGTTAQFQGDGILVYFGYPIAHEDDARRSVQAGLEILQSVGELARRMQTERGVTISVRVAVHTGLTLVGDLGGAA
ncbi:MAG: adenylate/guanylate cyclase domain-containing protein, partial [Casimicrobiaceae bacterium]